MEYTQEITESEDSLRVIFDNARDGILLADTTTQQFLFGNKAILDMLGYSSNEILDLSVADIHPRQSLPKVIAAFEKMVRGELTLAPDLPVLRKDGGIFHADITSFPLKLWGRTVLVGVFRDISERKKTEAALKQERDRNQKYLDTVQTIMVALDAQGRITMINRKGCELLGYNEQELLGRNWFETCLPQPMGMEKVYPVFRRIMSGDLKSVEYFENAVLCRDGQSRLIAWRNANLTDEDGRIIGTLSSGEDITARKQTEAEHEKLQSQLLQAQKMEFVGRLAGGVAHDFNNMLQAILGNIELALPEAPAGSAIRKNLESAHKAARRSADLTGQLLAFARKQAVMPRVLNLNDAITAMLKMLQRMIGEDIDLAWMPKSGLWLVKMDPAQIDQILANLFVNARDAIAGVGKITIETGNRTFDKDSTRLQPEAMPGEYVLLAVSDNGCGMEKDVLEHIFEPFFTTKEVGRGTGLGLATVYGIVKQNNGFINVYSEPGRGTTFKIYLPRHAQAFAEITTISAPQPPHGKGEIILIVEDEASILETAKAMLEKLGYMVLTAAKPSDALKLAETYAGKIDLLLTDVIMPQMNGRLLVEQIRAVQSGLKCLFMSGYTADAVARHGVLEESVSFIQKPFSYAELGQKVRLTLEG